MFAIVKLGNQQFKVKAGDFIRVPYQNVSQGEQIEIPVLGFGDESQFCFSAEELKKSKVKAVLLRQSLSKKVLVFKKKRRKGYRRTKGHRQKVSELKVLELCSPDGKVSKVEWKKAGSKGKKKVGDLQSTQDKTQKAGKLKINKEKTQKASPLKSSSEKIHKVSQEKTNTAESQKGKQVKFKKLKSSKDKTVKAETAKSKSTKASSEKTAKPVKTSKASVSAKKPKEKN